jgi:hypothetical protein
MIWRTSFTNGKSNGILENGRTIGILLRNIQKQENMPMYWHILIITRVLSLLASKLQKYAKEIMISLIEKGNRGKGLKMTLRK